MPLSAVGGIVSDMSDFGETWRLIRKRFDDAVLDKSAEQLNWVLHSDALTLGEMAIHVAGVEVSFCSQLTDTPTEGELDRVRRAATDGSVNNLPFPFSRDEITPELVKWALDTAREMTAKVIDDTSPELRSKQIQSALGPIVDGTGALARLAYHPGYHQGQAYLIESAPGFPLT